MLRFGSVLMVLLPLQVFAAETVTPSHSLNMLKMVMGLMMVLILIAALAWLAKRFLPHATQQGDVVKVLGGASVGTRERVVVLAVADRWLVVGVANGQVNAIADLTPGEINVETDANPNPSATFASKLKQSMQKLNEK